jgi:hypothetical protein
MLAATALTAPHATIVPFVVGAWSTAAALALEPRT